MIEETSYVDRISGLPDFILHQILSCLSTREAAQTGLLSKRWQYVWQTFPILDCNEWFFGRELDILNPKELGMPKDERRKIFNQRVKFMSYVDEKLHRFVEENLRVNKFLLHITLVSNNLAPRVDSWMELVTNLCVRELDLYLTVGRRRFYVLPMNIFTMESLKILNLRGCLLTSPLDTFAVKRCYLIELHLRDVFIDENAIQDLIGSIYPLEVLKLKNCLGFENLEIADHDKLKKLLYHPHKDFNVKKFIIKLPNLEEFDFCGVDKDKTPCEMININSCLKLKYLSLCHIRSGSKWLQDMVSSFHSLEHLYLGGCVLPKVMKLSSVILKEIYMCSCKNLVEAEFDTPNVRIFDYRGRNMTRLYMDSVAAKRVTELYVHPENMDTSWFMKLNKFLRDNKFQDLTLYITRRSGIEIPFSSEDIIGFQFPAPFKLDNMKLVTHALASGNHAALLDGLFWNIRPAILSLELNLYSVEFLKGLLKALVVEEPNCWCSPDANMKCWRHSLRDVRLMNLKGFTGDSRLDSIAVEKLINFVDDWAIEAKRIVKSYRPLTGETLSFHMLW